VDVDELIEKTIPKVLGELDPHSVYIPAKDVEESNQELKGSFSGIGIQFMIQSDTIYVSDVIPGGPAEKVGLMAGDRIVTIDDSLYVGKKINNDGAMKRLKGPKDSEVKLGIKRYGEKELVHYTIVRGNIPVKSVDASYMIDDRWCYIKANKFGETTYPEMLIALAQGMQQNMKGCIIDLRGNTGGYMAAAIQMVNEFLPKGEMIVYAEGENTSRYGEYANGRGTCQNLPLVVLTDETSASASEIFAGAIQDNDRGTVIGRRTFGKGLVQQSIPFADGSAVRLTISRYYTPAGRCIQKPYDEDYAYDIYERYAHGEMTSADSMKVDTTSVYYTVKGRRVYGGGGIIPDVFVPMDTTKATKFYISCNKKATPLRFASAMFDKYKSTLSEIEDFGQLEKYLDSIDLGSQFLEYAARVDGIKPAKGEWDESKPYMMPHILALVGRYSKLDDEAFYRFYLPIDDTIQAAMAQTGEVEW
jgi:carboxyl-terminal processing protease